MFEPHCPSMSRAPPHQSLLRIVLLALLLCSTNVSASIRKLQQSASVSLPSGTYSFDNTLDLSGDAGKTLKLLYTLLEDGTMHGALVADMSSSEYAGVSFGRAHRASSPTIIMTTDFIDGYYLDGYRTSTCNAGKGLWAVSNTALGTDNSGLTVGVFTSSGLSSGSLTIGYTFGPYSGGQLGDHTRGRSFAYDNVQMSLSASAAAAAPPTTTSPSASPSLPSASPQPSSGGTGTGTATCSGSHRCRKQPSVQPSTSLVSDGSLSVTEWVTQNAANDWRLMMSFVVAWIAAPGAILLLWPFVFDVAMDVKAGVRALTGSSKIQP